MICKLFLLYILPILQIFLTFASKSSTILTNINNTVAIKQKKSQYLLLNLSAERQDTHY